MDSRLNQQFAILAIYKGRSSSKAKETQIRSFIACLIRRISALIPKFILNAKTEKTSEDHSSNHGKCMSSQVISKAFQSYFKFSQYQNLFFSNFELNVNFYYSQVFKCIQTRKCFLCNGSNPVSLEYPEKFKQKKCN